MNASSRPVQRTAGRALLLALTTAPLVLSAPARADEEPSPAALVAARELFRQGTEDADAGRFTEALEKFKRVAEIKETPQVRFNLARCEESLGRTGAALADFELAASEARQDLPHAGDEVASLAQERADALRSRVPRLAVTPPSPAPEGLAVTVDGGKVASATWGVPLPVDPGPHVVEATAPGRGPFRAEIQVAAGESKRVAIALGGSAVATPPPPPAPSDVAARGPTGGGQRTAGWVTVGAGGALAVGSVVFLLLHDSAVSDLNAACPGGTCPASTPAQQSALYDKRSTALTDETVSSVLAGVSAAALVTGLVLVLTAPHEEASVPAPTARIVPSAPQASAGASLLVSF